MFQSSVTFVLLTFATITQFAGVYGYSQVLLTGSNNRNNEGPKIFKALNMDLIYPKTFNSSENVISTTQVSLAAVATTTTTTPASLLPSNYYALEQQQQQQQQQHHWQTENAATSAPAIYVTPANDALNVPAMSTAEVTAATMPLSQGNEQIKQEQQQLEQTQQQQQQQQEAEEVQQLLLQQQQQQHQQQQDASTGRAVDYRPAYQFNQLITPLIKNSQPHPLRPATANAVTRLRQRPVVYARPQATPAATSMSALGKIIYPQAYQASRAESDKLRGKTQISDRFTPGEAVASGLFTQKHNHHNHNHNHEHSHKANNGIKVPASSNLVQSYAPPKDLYSFPPNINAKYPPPAKDPKLVLPSSSVNSYVAPPSGPLRANSGLNTLATAASNTNGYKYAGPVSPAYLPPATAEAQKDDDKGGGADMDDAGNDDTIGVLPASAMDAPGGGGDAKDEGGDDAGGGSADQPDAGMSDDANDHDHANADHPLTGYDDDKEYPTPPPGWLEEHPETTHDHAPPHDHHHDHQPHFDYHDHFPSYPHISSYSSHHSYPEIIYDDHDHDHYHHHHVEMPTLPPITTEIPPEPAPEPRVKKYSYFYIGRKLWYIPLYFTVWFSFYVLWLILKSIARHKVNLPNHYVNRRSLALNDDTQAKEYINELTVSVLEKIDNFKSKYNA